VPFAGLLLSILGELSLLRDRFLTLMAHGGDELDWSAIGGLAAKDAGEEG
jgi:hypothetical protein